MPEHPEKPQPMVLVPQRFSVGTIKNKDGGDNLAIILVVDDNKPELVIVLSPSAGASLILDASKTLDTIFSAPTPEPKKAIIHG